MQDVNNDMDDLFKQAAERYPLKTDGADWDKVLAGLNDADAPVAVTFTTQSNRKKRALWLLLLLPFASLYIVLHNHVETKNNTSNKVKSSNQNKVITNDNIAGNKAKPQANALLKQDNSSATSSNHQVENVTKKSNEISGRITNVSLQNKNNSKHQNVNFSFINDDEKSISNTTNKSNKQVDENRIGNNKNKVDEKQPDDVLKRIQNTTAKQNETEIAEQKNTVASDAFTANKKDSTETKANQKKEDKKVIAKLKTQQQQGFYAGAMASFDVSTIKLQRINKTGYGFNLMVGYRFSKHVSAESGLGWSLKNYYSIGKYFDIKKTGLSADSKVVYTNGNCNMLEVPVAVKYDFGESKNHSFFTKAGISSYFMKKESYAYRVYHGTNVADAYDATRSYKNSCSDLFSVADFSVGYQLRLNKATTLRVEPYLKVPLRGIGIAKLPITSTGISVGFTRSF